MKKEPDALRAVGFVLNYLKDGPARIDDLYRAAHEEFGFTTWEVAKAGRHLGILGKKLQGVSYVYRPHNLHAIWWANRPHACRWHLVSRAAG